MKENNNKGFAILSAAGLIVKILSLIYIPFLLKIIGQEGYGIYNAAYQVYVFMYVIANSGIPAAISKLISEYIAKGNYKDAVKSFKIARLMLFIVGLVLSIVMFLFSMPLAKVLKYEKSYYSILALSPAILFTSINSAYRGYFQGRQNMKPTAVSQIIEQVINTIFTLVFAALLINKGVEEACAGGTIGTTLGSLISVIYLSLYYKKHKKIRVPKGYMGSEIKRHTNKELISKIISYALPITICIGVTYAGNLVDLFNTKARLLATGVLSESEATIKYGILVKYQQLLNVPIAIISALSATILPAISGAAALENRREIRRKITYAFKLCSMIALPSAVGLAVLSTPIFNMIFTKQFSDGAILMKYGSAVLILTSIVQIQTTILQGINKLYTATFFAVLGIVGKIVSNYFLISIPQINILGAVFGSMIGLMIPFVLNYILINKHLSTKISMPKIASKPFIASFVMGVGVYFSFSLLNKLAGFIGVNYITNLISTALSIVIGIYIYLYILIVTGGIKKRDIKDMPSKVTRIIPKWMGSRLK